MMKVWWRPECRWLGCRVADGRCVRMHFGVACTLLSLEVEADGNCSKDTRSRIGMAKKRMLDLVPIWKDRGINKDLKMKLVRSLVWTVLTYGAEGWTLKKADEKRIESAEMWFYRRLL